MFLKWKKWKILEEMEVVGKKEKSLREKMSKETGKQEHTQHAHTTQSRSFHAYVCTSEL